MLLSDAVGVGPATSSFHAGEREIQLDVTALVEDTRDPHLRDADIHLEVDGPLVTSHPLGGRWSTCLAGNHWPAAW